MATIEIDDDMLQIVQDNAGKLKVEPKAFLRKAIAAYLYFLEQQKQGSKILVQESNSQYKQVGLS
jgi:predicted transcriptional regulator